MSSEPVISAVGLSKSYRIAKRQPGLGGALKGVFNRQYQEINAISDLSLSLVPGEILGYIGPNGAGKSTTIKILSGILVPDRGECSVLGLVPWDSRVELAQRIGVVFGQRTQLWWDLPVIESFELLQAIYRVTPAQYRRKLHELAELLELRPLFSVPVRQLSLGQRMKCEIAAALLHEPRLLLLDEPTIGLDAVAKLSIRKFIKRLCSETGQAIILTTHDMTDIESLCERVVLIHEGQKLFDGELQELCSRAKAPRYLTVDLEEDVGAIDIPGVKNVHRSGQRLRIAYHPERLSAAKLISNVVTNFRIRDIYVESQQIEELIAEVYRTLDEKSVPRSF